jgi:hypothetical protein
MSSHSQTPYPATKSMADVGLLELQHAADAQETARG